MRICSFLPSGTEIAAFLGLEKDLVGISHECDYPRSVRSLPHVVTSRFESKKYLPSEIEHLVSQSLKEGKSLYQVNEELLFDLKPDLILTQNLCQVCAPSGNEAAQVLKRLPKSTQVLYLTPRNLRQVFDNILDVGRATGRLALAHEKVLRLREEIHEVEQQVKDVHPKEVFFMEWIEPPYCAGHWLPEMIEIAGGEDLLEMPGRDSIRVPWEKILEFNPEIFIVSPCGYHLEGAARSAERLLTKAPGLDNLRAYQNGQIYAVDADSYFVRPGPRIVEGIKILAHILHPESYTSFIPPHSYKRILQKPLVLAH